LLDEFVTPAAVVEQHSLFEHVGERVAERLRLLHDGLRVRHVPLRLLHDGPRLLRAFLSGRCARRNA
jgi:hypothetical protein